MTLVDRWIGRYVDSVIESAAFDSAQAPQVPQKVFEFHSEISNL